MAKDSQQELIAILDFGSQYTQLISRRVRECKVYSEILPYNIPPRKLLAKRPKGIILSGGPASVTADKSPVCDRAIFDLGIPILGICYGMQLMGSLLGGEVGYSPRREYGRTALLIDKKDELFGDLGKKLTVWMSHGDRITKLPSGFEKIAHSQNSPLAVIKNKAKKLYGIQFHPEVVHTPKGHQILKNFLFKISSCSGEWTMKSFVEHSVEEVRNRVKKGKVICGLSGGVDSSALAMLLHRAIGDRLVCIFVDNGLLRKGEAEKVVETFKNYNIDLRAIDAEKSFIRKLEGILEPERKRKIIGREFIRVFEREAKKIGSIKFLAQGTLYPDVIESHSAFGGPSATIKSHHNVGGLPQKMKLELIEPFRNLFKDEVRLVGKELGLPDKIIWRHPFPGPGLAVRIIGEVTPDRLNMLREVDSIIIEEIKRSRLYKKIWQVFGVLLPVKTVGVMGDERTYENVAAIRAVASLDGMTADWVKLPHKLLERLSNRIINEVKGINRVVYDISSKPPSTIEWE